MLFGPDGKAVPLSARAFDTLLYLVERPNQLIDKQMLIKATNAAATAWSSSAARNCATVYSGCCPKIRSRSPRLVAKLTMIKMAFSAAPAYISLTELSSDGGAGDRCRAGAGP